MFRVLASTRQGQVDIMAYAERDSAAPATAPSLYFVALARPGRPLHEVRVRDESQARLFYCLFLGSTLACKEYP